MRPYIMKVLVAFVCLLGSVQGALAVDHLRLTDIRSLGMGGSGVVQSALFNPALVALSEDKLIRMGYFNRYNLRELGTVSGSFYFPNDLLSAGMNISSFGYDAYRESLFRLFAGKRLGERWALGVGIQYALLQTELFEEAPSRLSADMGLTFSPVDNLLTGLLIMNVPSVKLGGKDIDVKDFSFYYIQVGFQWEFINNLFISGHLGNDGERALSGGLGMEYVPFERFSLRAGVAGEPFLPSFGAGYGFRHFGVDVSVVYHPVLGASTGFGLSYTL
ncbi:MAG: hypothetical protein LBQ78_00785 [Tannerellaceae bacterium]|jgi:hypothetical protein|nr:hypothetical protein [Tannerellaceae bacterium]